MGVDFAIELEPDTGDASPISDDELTDYYRAHCPPGSPPLTELREQVGRALALARRRVDPFVELHQQFVDRFGREQIWWDDELEAAAARLGVTALRNFQVSAPKWCDPADGLRTVRALQTFLRAAHPDRSHQLSCLDLIAQILGVAEQRRRRWRLLALW
jgi:hypothetical protein